MTAWIQLSLTSGKHEVCPREDIWACTAVCTVPGPVLQCALYLGLYCSVHCTWACTAVCTVPGPVLQCALYLGLYYSVHCTWACTAVCTIPGPVLQCALYLGLYCSVHCTWACTAVCTVHTWAIDHRAHELQSGLEVLRWKREFRSILYAQTYVQSKQQMSNSQWSNNNTQWERHLTNKQSSMGYTSQTT